MIITLELCCHVDTHLHAQSLACHYNRSYICPQSPVVLYHIYISYLFPQRYPFNILLIMRYYNHLMIWVFLLLLLGCVVDESYASLEGRDAPSEYFSLEGCKGRSNLYTTTLISTLDNHDDRQKEEKEERVS